MKQLIRCLMLASLVLSLPVSALQLNSLPTPFEAEYQATYKGKTIRATRSLKQENEHWVLRTKLRNFFASINEESWLNITGDLNLTAQRYRYQRKIFGAKKTQTRDFDWAKQQVTFSEGEKTGRYSITSETFDQASQQLFIQTMLMRGETDFEIDIAARNRVKHYIYHATVSETVDIPFGEIDAIKVIKISESDDKRSLSMWFAPSLNYQLVKLEQTEKDGKNYSLAMKSYKAL